MNRFVFCALLSTAVSAIAADPATAPKTMSVAVQAGVSESLAREGRAAINRGMAWLIQQQKPDGSWSSPEYPALTALPLWAMSRGGCTNTAAMDKAQQFILKFVRPDGSIYADPSDKERKGGGLKNYNTAICMVALHATGKPDMVPVVQKARSFVAGSQHLGGDEYTGGMGYDADTKKPYADLSNSYMAYEAMRLTQSVEDLRKQGDARADLDWKAAQEFLAKVQSSKPGDAAADKGGFGYSPELKEAKAGTYTNAAGEVRFHAYGTMTYAGLLSLIYADVSKSDTRVDSAHDWAMKHWTLAENPGMGPQGMYYFINVLTKALAAYGQDVITLPSGQQVNWRNAVIERLVNLQRDSNGAGFWKNESGRWEEMDPVLVTSYSLIALEIALGKQ